MIDEKGKQENIFDNLNTNYSCCERREEIWEVDPRKKICCEFPKSAPSIQPEPEPTQRPELTTEPEPEPGPTTDPEPGPEPTTIEPEPTIQPDVETTASGTILNSFLLMYRI